MTDRAAIIEECARIADARADKLREKAKHERSPSGRGYFDKAIEARVIADAIRRLKDARV